VGRDEVQRRLEAKWGSELAGYVIAQETHEDGGHHLHLGLRFKDKKNFTDPTCMDFLTDQHANVQTSKFPKKWINYCLKEDESAIVVGDIKEEFTWQEIMASKTPKELHDKLMEARPRDAAMSFLRIKQNWSATQSFRGKRKFERRKMPDVKVFFGKTHSGKSYGCEQFAIDMEKSMTAIDMTELRRGWFAGWRGDEEICWLDEFRGDSMKPADFLQLINNTADTKPIKGGAIEFDPETILITSSDHPINWWPKWYKKDPNNWAQVSRRIEIYHCQWDGKDTYTKDLLDNSGAELWITPEEEIIKVGFS